MKLRQLLCKAGIEPLTLSGDVDVTSVTADSRKARPGCCFIAVRGPSADGHDFIDDALAAGAAAVVSEDVSPPGGAGVWARVSDGAVAAGLLAQAFADWPARDLTLLGVTGTKGKTTFTYIARHILRQAGHPTGLIGTIRHDLGGREVESRNTTPGPMELAELLAEMRSAGLTHAAMEVSSHALHQRRTAGLRFTAAAFTNLSGDHLDYHGDMADYQDAKATLFGDLSPDATAVLNADDPAAGTIAERTAARIVWYSLESPAELKATIHSQNAAGTTFGLHLDGRDVSISSRLLGRHNVYNCLAAAGCCLAAGVAPETIAEALSRPVDVPGRLQRVAHDGPIDVFVDYAHTDDALRNALSTLRPLVKGRLWVVFGCGGDRDRTKRPRMAAEADRLADRVVITSDNPRTEDPASIIEEILAGVPRGRANDRVAVAPDRREAIGLAIEQAEPGDMVLLAGKGHETYQIIGERKYRFDDAEEALAALSARRCEGGV